MPKRSITAGIRCPKCSSLRNRVAKTIPRNGTKDRILDCEEPGCQHRFATRESVVGAIDSDTLAIYSRKIAKGVKEELLRLTSSNVAREN